MNYHERYNFISYVDSYFYGIESAVYVYTTVSQLRTYVGERLPIKMCFTTKLLRL